VAWKLHAIGSLSLLATGHIAAVDQLQRRRRRDQASDVRYWESSRATVHVVDRRKPAVEGAIVLRPESTFPAIEALPAERLGLLR
jgi:hypothetical protein